MLGSSTADDQCVWFRRIIEDLEERATDTKAIDYIDLQPTNTRIDSALVERMKTLVQEKLISKVSMSINVSKSCVDFCGSSLHHHMFGG